MAGKLAKGVEFFEQYRTQHPDKTWADQLLFDIYIRADQRASAIELMNQIVSSEQSESKNFGLLARLHTDANQSDKALAVLEAGIQRFPESTILQTNRASLFERLNKIPHAIRAYEGVSRT